MNTQEFINDARERRKLALNGKSKSLDQKFILEIKEVTRYEYKTDLFIQSKCVYDIDGKK